MRVVIISFLLFAFFISCNKKQKPVNKFLGTWYGTEYIVPSESVLKINKDSSFSYKSAGCQWRVVSKGNWKIIGDSLELNSTSSDTCYKVFPFVFCISFGADAIEDKFTIPNCEANNDVSFAQFTKEVFYLKNDSLTYKIKAGSNCSDTLRIVYARTGKIRKTN